MPSPAKPLCEETARPVGSQTQNDFLRKENADLKRKNADLSKRNTDLKQELLKLKELLAGVKKAPLPPPPPPPPPPSQPRKRKQDPEEASSPPPKRPQFGKPEGAGSSPAPTSSPFGSTTKPFGSTSDPPKPSPLPRANFPGFGAYASVPSAFGFGNPPQANPWKPAGVPPSFQSQCFTWKIHAAEILVKAKGAGSLTVMDFPEPPHEMCKEKGCAENQGRALRACEHTVEKAVRTLMGGMVNDGVKEDFLKKQRNLYHPDHGMKYAGKQDAATVEKLVKMFGEVSGVVCGLLEELSGKGKEAWLPDAAPRPRAL